MVNVPLFDQSLDWLETDTEIFYYHGQKKIHQDKLDDQNEQNEVHARSGLISAITNN
jgi:hypothetical protein